MKQINFHSNSKSKLVSLIKDENFDFDTEFESYLLNFMDDLSDWSEEGKTVNTGILITNTFSEISSNLPFCRNIDLGFSNTFEQTLLQVLKFISPISSNEWIIYIEKVKKKYRYGIFTVEDTITSPSFFDLLTQINFSNLQLIFINKVSKRNIIAINSKMKSIHFRFNAKNSNIDIKSKIELLVPKLTSNIQTAHSEEFSRFLVKLFKKILLNSHGALIGVIKTMEMSELKKKIKGSVYLEPPIDIYKVFQDFKDLNSNSAFTALVNFSDIIQNIIIQDGICIMDDQCKILCYRYFIKNKLNPNTVITGGARSRAFETMKLDKIFISSFFKSSDGEEKIG